MWKRGGGDWEALKHFPKRPNFFFFCKTSSYFTIVWVLHLCSFNKSPQQKLDSSTISFHLFVSLAVFQIQCVIQWPVCVTTTLQYIAIVFQQHVFQQHVFQQQGRQFKSGNFEVNWGGGAGVTACLYEGAVEPLYRQFF